MSEIMVAEAEAETLRLELKRWEADFAATHQGQKPTREDIKQDRDICKSATWDAQPHQCSIRCKH